MPRHNRVRPVWRRQNTAGTELSRWRNRPLKSDPAAPLRLAKLDGKYRMLLRQIRVEEPGDDLIIDRGSRTVTTYRGHKDLPSGYWVYARPYWFIWRDAGAEKRRKLGWSPEQITGIV